MLPKARRLLRLSAQDAGILSEALTIVAAVRLAMWRHRADAFRVRIASLDATAKPPVDQLRRTSWAVAAAARLVPGATCLTQALAGQYLLARRGYVSTVRLSLPEGQPDLRPHAWLMAGEVIVLGGSAADYAAHRPFLDYLPGSRATGLRHVTPGAETAG